MKAVRINQFGDLDVLEYGDYNNPTLTDNDVLVKVMATAVSGWDIKYRRGDVANKKLPGRAAFPLPQQLGRECAGIVEKIGKNVQRFKVGDNVMGLVHPENTFCENALKGFGNLSTGIDYPAHTMFGGYAQYVSRPENYWLQIPQALDFDEVAAGSWSFPTSHRIIVDRCKVKLGDTVLITGISGGMGNALLQWATLCGANVIGTTSNASKVSSISSLGIDNIIVSSALDKAQQSLEKMTLGKGIDHAIELTGHNDLLKFCIDNLNCGGHLCPVGGDMENDCLPITIKDLVRSELSVVGIRASQLKDQYKFIQMLAQNRIYVPIAKTLPLSAIKEAHRLVETKEVVGKVVLRPWD